MRLKRDSEPRRELSGSRPVTQLNIVLKAESHMWLKSPELASSEVHILCNCTVTVLIQVLFYLSKYFSSRKISYFYSVAFFSIKYCHFLHLLTSYASRFFVCLFFLHRDSITSARNLFYGIERCRIRYVVVWSP